MKPKPFLRIDPYFNDVPWEIIYDDNGRVLGEVFKVFTEKDPWRRRKMKKEKSS